MTKDEQIAFVQDLTASVVKQMVERADRWPQEWDGFELRELLFVKFRAERMDDMKDRRLKRAHDFQKVYRQTDI